MGIFDDLIPAASASTKGGGLFDDLIPAGPQIDFGRPVEEVRADIAKIPAGPQRDQIMRQWADAYVAKEREGVKKLDVPLVGNPLRLGDTVRNLARGTIVGSFADELNAGTNAALHKITGERFGAPYDESVEYQRALDRALDKESPIGSTVEKVAGGLATAAPVAKAAFGAAKGAVAKSGVGGLLGGAYSYLTGLGDAEGDFEQRHDKALEKVPLGMGVGAVLPPAITGTMHVGGKINEALSPTIARAGATIADIPRRIGLPAMSASRAPASVGADAAADQMIANQLVREGVPASEVSRRLDEIADDTKFWSSGRAQDTTVLGDLTPGLQKLLGSAVRANPEAARHVKMGLEARQTGITPEGATPQALADIGLPTRARLSAPMTGAEAERQLGSRFGTPKEEAVPMGQGDRFYDALKRALRIADEKHHGHGATGYRTKEQFSETAKAEAQPAYEQFYRSGDNVSLRPHITPVLDYWIKGDRLAQEPAPVQAAIRRIAALYMPNGSPIATAERFDRTKRYIDDKYIGPAFKAGNNHIGALLSNLRDDLLHGMKTADGVVGGVDNIATNGMGNLYKSARANWGSHQQAIEAVELGQSVWKEGSDIGVDAINAAIAAGNGKLVRLGLLDGYRLAAERMKRGANKGSLFDSERIEKILEAAIPRTNSRTDALHHNPERFGRFIGTEGRKVETREVVQGGSPTQRNKRDDDSYDIMSRWGETIENFKSTRSLTALGIDVMGNMLAKVFGMRADMSAALAQKLFTADKGERARVMAAVARRMGPSRFEHLSRMMDEYYTTVVATRQVAMPSAEAAE